MNTPPFAPPPNSPDASDNEAAPGEDSLARFLVRGAPVRGEAISLDTAWREAIRQHDYPACVRQQLGELCAAGLLLSASLKFEGSLILQIHGDGPVALLVVECNDRGHFRATAKLREHQTCPEDAPLAYLVNAHGRGRFVVTLDPSTRSPNRQPYQGIVPFEGDTVAEVLERYMARSEQVPTRLWLAADEQRAAGLLLQRLPQEGGHRSDSTVQHEAEHSRVRGFATAPSTASSPPPSEAHEDLEWFSADEFAAALIG